MRNVVIYAYERKQGDKCYSKVENGTGKFHAWGVNYEEFETGAGNYSTAIVERNDGTVENIQADLIRFMD